MVTVASTPPIVTDGDLTANAASYARHLRAANLSPMTQRAYLDALTWLAASLPRTGSPPPTSCQGKGSVEACFLVGRR